MSEEPRKREKKTTKQKVAKDKRPASEAASPALGREQLEALRRRLQKKFH